MSEIIFEFQEVPEFNFLIDLQGASLYNKWIELGNVGDYNDFFDWLKIKGDTGYSAYEIAVQLGFVGTEAQWILSLKGENGEKGDPGDPGVQGPKGDNGATGATGAQGLQGIKGDKGDTGNAGADGDHYHTTSTTSFTLGTSGSQTIVLDDINVDYSIGQTVIIAYDIDHHQHGTVSSYNSATGELTFVKDNKTGAGTFASWTVNLNGAVGIQGEQGIQGIQGLKGDKGDTGNTGAKGDTGSTGAQGKSAYEVAVQNGFVGTEADWIESIKNIDVDYSLVTSFRTLYNY